MRLHDLAPFQGATQSRKRVGRGVGSGWGCTAGRGAKGHNSRSGGGVRPGYEGGQMPIHRRLPKRGFLNIFKKEIAVVNVGDLDRFQSGATVDEAALIKAGLLKGKYQGIKLLAQGQIDRALTVKVDAVSEGARRKIEAAGGKVEVL